MNSSTRKISARDRAARKLDSFEKECSAVFKGQQNKGGSRQGSVSKKKKPAKRTEKVPNASSGSGSDLDDAHPDLLHARGRDLPDREPESFPESEDEDSKDFSDRSRTPYAGKKLLMNKKRKVVGRQDRILPPVAEKKPRSVETEIPETVIQGTEDTNPVNGQDPAFRSGAAITEDENLSDIGKLDVLSGPFLKSFLSRISTQFADKVYRELNDVNTKLDSLLGQIASLDKDISDVKALSSSSGAIASKGNLEKSVKVWRQVLDNETPFIEVGFSDFVQSKVLSMCLCHLFVSKFNETSDRITDRAANSLLALLFGLQKDKSKSAYQKGDGRSHADFRYMFALSLIYHVQHNRSSQFLDDVEQSSLKDPSQKDSYQVDIPRNTSETSHGRVSANHAIATVLDRPRQPRWLHLGFIKVEDLTVARRYAESPAGSRDKGLKHAPTDRDIAVHGCRKLYTLVTTSFHRRRAGSRVQFFEDFGYLAADWSRLTRDVDKHSLCLSWAYEEGKDFDRTLSSIPCARKHVSNDEVSRKWNAKLWEEFRSEARDMIISVSHDVVVVQGETVSKSKDRGKVLKLHRALNLLDVAAGFIVRYVQLPSIKDFIGMCENSIKTIFMVAVAFRHLAQCLIWDPLVDISSIKCELLPVDRLQPPPSVQERSANSRLLRMTKSQYEELNLPSSSFARRSNASAPDPGESSEHQDGNWGQEIDPSQGLEICM